MFKSILVASEPSCRAQPSVQLEVRLGDPSISVRMDDGIGADVTAELVDQSTPAHLVRGTRGLSGVGRLLPDNVALDLMGNPEIEILAAPPQA